MKKNIMFLSSLCASLLVACQSSNDLDMTAFNNLSFDGKTIYLVGEMNDYKISQAYALKKEEDNRFCVVTALRSDLAPYRFKFTDENWSNGTNFGFKNPPGTMYEGSAMQALNANSRFEDMRFYPEKDGMYSFCLIKSNDSYYAQVSAVDKKELAYLAHYIALVNNND